MEFEGQKTWLKLIPRLNEARTRLYVAQKAIDLGRSGIKTLHEITKISKTTILSGIKELKSSTFSPSKRVRKAGAGRKSAEEA